MGISAIREGLSDKYSQKNPVLDSWFKQVSKNDTTNKLIQDLKNGGIQTSNQDAFLKVLLDKTMGENQSVNRSMAEIKRRLFEFKGKVGSLKELMVLAYLAAKGPKSISVNELLQLNGDETQLSDLVQQAKDANTTQGVSLKKFCQSFCEAANETLASAEDAEIPSDIGAGIAVNEYDAQRFRQLKIEFRSPVFEVLEEKHEFEKELAQANAKKLEEKRDEQSQQVKQESEKHRTRKQLELTALEQQKHSISPYNYTAQRNRIKMEILQKDSALKNLVA